MIQLLFTLIFAEMALVMFLLFRTPLRKLSIMGLDRLKRGRGPVVIKTVAGTVFLFFSSSVYSMMKIQERFTESTSEVNPTDQVLMGKHLLEASLMGFFLFLGLMIDRLHHYIRELRLLRKSMETVKKQSRGAEDSTTHGTEVVKPLEEEVIGLKAKMKNMESVKKQNQLDDFNYLSAGDSGKIKLMEGEINSLKMKVKHLESEYEAKVKEVKKAEVNAVALSKQSEGFLLEYDRLLEDNQNLRTQLQSIDRKLSYSNSKKWM